MKLGSKSLKKSVSGQFLKINPKQLSKPRKQTSVFIVEVKVLGFASKSEFVGIFYRIRLKIY